MIIPKPIGLSRDGLNSRCRPLWLVVCCPFWLNLWLLWSQLSPFRLSPFRRVAGDQLSLLVVQFAPFRQAAGYKLSILAVQIVAVSTRRWRSTIYTRRSDCRRFAVLLAISYLYPPFRLSPFRRDVTVRAFSLIQNWNAKAWEEGMTVDTNNFGYLPRRSSKKCDL